MVSSYVKYSPVVTNKKPSGASCLDVMLGAAPSFRRHNSYSALATHEEHREEEEDEEEEEEQTEVQDTVVQPHSMGYWDALKSAAAACRSNVTLNTTLPRDDTETLLSDAAEQRLESTTPSGGNVPVHSNRQFRDHCLDMHCPVNDGDIAQPDVFVVPHGLTKARGTQSLIYDHTFQHEPAVSPLHGRVHGQCRYIKAQMRSTDQYVRQTLHTSKGFASNKMKALLALTDSFVRWSVRGSRPWLLLCLVLGVTAVSISSVALSRANGLLKHVALKDSHEAHAKLKKIESNFNVKLRAGHDASLKAHAKIEKVNTTLHEKVEKGISSSVQAHAKIDQLEKDLDAKLDTKHRSLDGDVKAMKNHLEQELQKERLVSKEALDRIMQLETLVKEQRRTYFGGIKEHAMIYILSVAVLIFLAVFIRHNFEAQRLATITLPDP